MRFFLYDRRTLTGDWKIRFTAIIRQNTGIDAAYIEFPFDVQKSFGVNGQVKVKAVFDSQIEYRDSLAKMGFNPHILSNTKGIRSKLNKTFGDSIDVMIEQDLAPREINLPVRKNLSEE